MEAVVIVTVLMLVQYMFFGVQVGGARQRTGVSAPAMSGNPEFERICRIHQNSLEQLIVLIPAMWMYAHYVNPLWGAGIGAVYLIGRMIYRSAYLAEPTGRTLGFALSFLPGARHGRCEGSRSGFRGVCTHRNITLPNIDHPGPRPSRTVCRRCGHFRIYDAGQFGATVNIYRRQLSAWRSRRERDDQQN